MNFPATPSRAASYRAPENYNVVIVIIIMFFVNTYSEEMTMVPISYATRMLEVTSARKEFNLKLN